MPPLPSLYLADADDGAERLTDSRSRPVRRTARPSANATNAVAAAESFDSADLKHALIKSCILLAYADGHYSTAEQAKVREYALLLGVSAVELAGMESAVADHLIQQLARVQNTDALQEVVREIAQR